MRPIVRSGGRWGLAVSFVAAVIFSACGGGGKGQSADAKDGGRKASSSGTPVAIVNFAFSPKDLEVPAGTRVTWTNQDDTAHNIQDLSELNTPMSPELKKGGTFSITYPKPGTYPYVCGLHTYMTGTVKVT
jgi:plastocyanin